MGFPIVTDADRYWALAQMPIWFRIGHEGEESEIVDDGAWLDGEAEKSDDERPSWSLFVAEEIEKFERHYAGQYRPSEEWSSMWRLGWWPRVSPRKRFPRSAPREFQPFFREGSPEFSRALKVATPAEHRMWSRFGVAQFKPDDPRLNRVQRAPRPAKPEAA